MKKPCSLVKKIMLIIYGSLLLPETGLLLKNGRLTSAQVMVRDKHLP